MINSVPIPRRSRFWLSILTCALLVGSAALISAPAASAASTSSRPLVFGAVGGDFTALDQAAGKKVARHVYGQFQGNVPTGEMITVNAQSLPWRQVSGASTSSALYKDIVRWADTLKARGGSIQVAFGHEPELASKSSQGSAEEYKQAYRKVVDIFRSRSVANVRWVLQLTDWSFRAASSDRVYAGNWYPGDAYIDIVGADAYNWHTCGEGLGRDVPLSTVAGGVVTFAKAHGKLASLPEFGANNTVKRDQWLRDGHAWMKANSSLFASAFYFNHPPTNPKNMDCVWPLSKPAEMTAFGEIARDKWSTGSAAPAVPAKPGPAKPAPANPAPANPAPAKPAPVPENPAPVVDNSWLVVGGVGDVVSLDQSAGRKVARHVYGQLQAGVPTGEMITVTAKGQSWNAVADASPGSELHQDMVRWADTLKSRSGKIQVAFDQEPELSTKISMGTAEDYKQAYRKVVDIFRERGATNVQWVLQLADWSYRTSAADRAYADRWYPGDSYVDIVGASVYNWHTCGNATRKDVPLAESGAGLVEFAKAHGKLASLPEFAASQAVQRDEWLRDGYAWMKTNKSVLSSVFYVNRMSANGKSDSCSWSLSSATEEEAFAAIAAGS